MSGAGTVPEFKPKDIKNNLKLVAKHPIDFAKHVAGGEIAGLGLGFLGGAFVTTPVAALLALKNHKFGRPEYWKSFKETMGTGLLAESTGMGVAGSIIGGNKFFEKYKSSEAIKHACYEAAVIDELEKIADIKINDDQTFHPGRLGAALGASAGLQFGVKDMWNNIGEARGGRKMQRIIKHNLKTLPFKEKIKFIARLSKEFAKPALIGLAGGALLGEAAAKSLERAAVSKKDDKKFSFKDWAFKKQAKKNKFLTEKEQKEIGKGTVKGAYIGAGAGAIPTAFAFSNKIMYQKNTPLRLRLLNALAFAPMGAAMGAPVGAIIGAGAVTSRQAAEKGAVVVGDAAKDISDKIKQSQK
jgi:hypothetical protein